MDDSSPDFKIVWIINPEHREVVIGRTQLDVSLIPMSQVKELHREATVPPCNHDGTVMRLNSPVNDDPVAIPQPRILHGVTLHIAIE